jgi:hypothetical protein
MTTDYSQRIRERAYQIWDRDGRPEGRAHEHWVQAEQEIAEEDTPVFVQERERGERNGGQAEHSPERSRPAEDNETKGLGKPRKA